MKIIKTKEILKNFEGENIKNGEKDLTVGMAISMMLGGQVSNPTLGWILGKKFACDEEVELKAEEIVFIKKELEDTKIWFSIVTGQLIEILDGKVDETKK